MPVLEVKNLKKSFGTTDVLQGVSFTLEQGQVLTTIHSPSTALCCKPLWPLSGVTATDSTWVLPLLWLADSLSSTGQPDCFF